MRHIWSTEASGIIFRIAVGEPHFIADNSHKFFDDSVPLKISAILDGEIYEAFFSVVSCRDSRSAVRDLLDEERRRLGFRLRSGWGGLGCTFGMSSSFFNWSLVESSSSSCPSSFLSLGLPASCGLSSDAVPLSESEEVDCYPALDLLPGQMPISKSGVISRSSITLFSLYYIV